MTSEHRIERLEQALGVEADTLRRAPIVLYDPEDVPEESAARDGWFKSQRPVERGAVFYLPDNGRGP